MPGRGPPTKADQIDYLVQWFQEYSDLQREDFLSILVDKYTINDSEVISEALKNMNVADRPPSIFQCRMKLFNEWFDTWEEEEKEELMHRIKTLDSLFIEKFQNSLENHVNNSY